MSIIKLLADFPNYSARKVRRLAKQISLVQRLSEVVALGQETGVLKGIEADLLEFNLLQAKTEEQLNDDLGKVGEIPALQMPMIERISVTPVEAARKAIYEIQAWLLDHNPGCEHNPEWKAVYQKAQGIINGQSFYTDRTPIQARLSPQDSLPLDQQQ